MWLGPGVSARFILVTDSDMASLGLNASPVHGRAIRQLIRFTRTLAFSLALGLAIRPSTGGPSGLGGRRWNLQTGREQRGG
jgi:hypothetical protein